MHVREFDGLLDLNGRFLSFTDQNVPSHKKIKQFFIWITTWFIFNFTVTASMMRTRENAEELMILGLATEDRSKVSVPDIYFM